MNRITKSALGTTALATILAGIATIPATAAPGDPVGISAESEAYLSSIGVTATYDNGGIRLVSTSGETTAIILGTGVIATQDKISPIAAGSTLPAHGSYPWAQEVGKLGQNVYGYAHTSWRTGGLSGEDVTTIGDRMTSALSAETYAGGGGYGHEQSTFSDCTDSAGICGVYIVGVVADVDDAGNDVLRTTAEPVWVPVITDPSQWEDSAGIVWDDSTGIGTRTNDVGIPEGYRAQSTASLTSPWLPPSRTDIPTLDESTVNPDGTVTIGISDGGVLARIGHITLNLGYLGGQVIIPEEPTPEPPVVTPAPEPEPVVEPTPEAPTAEPEPQPTPEAPVLRFETGDFAPRSDVSPASSGFTTAQWLYLGIAGVASLALAGGLLLSARSAETPRTRRTLFVSSPVAGVIGLSVVTVLALQGCSTAPEETAPEPVSAPVASQPSHDESESATEPQERAGDVAPESTTEPAADDRLVIPSVGLDVPLKTEKIGRSLTIDPPSLTDAWEEMTGGDFYPGQDGDGTVLVAMHASNQVDAPGNRVSTADGQIAVQVGDQVQVRDETFVVTKVTTINKSQWSGLREGWDSVEGRLLLVTCLPPQEAGEFIASENIVIVGKRVEV